MPFTPPLKGSHRPAARRITFGTIPNGQDVAFAKAIVTYLETNYCVDQSRIFAEGMSYGGIMTSTLGCQAPDIFRARGIIHNGLRVFSAAEITKFFLQF